MSNKEQTKEYDKELAKTKKALSEGFVMMNKYADSILKSLDAILEIAKQSRKDNKELKARWEKLKRWGESDLNLTIKMQEFETEGCPS